MDAYWAMINACSDGDIYSVGKWMAHVEKEDINTGLYCACESGNFNIIHFLIENGADDWNYALIGAAKNGNINIANLIINKGATNYNVGLYWASVKGNLEIARLMIEKGADEFEFCLEDAREVELVKLLKFHC